LGNDEDSEYDIKKTTNKLYVATYKINLTLKLYVQILKKNRRTIFDEISYEVFTTQCIPASLGNFIEFLSPYSRLRFREFRLPRRFMHIAYYNTAYTYVL